MNFEEAFVTIQVDLRHALISIAKALDFVGIDDLHHGHRVAYIAYSCAVKLGWDEEQCQTAFFAGLIHDCGVSQSKEHLRLVKQLVPPQVSVHCERGATALNSCEVLRQFSSCILYHHTPWQELKKITLTTEQRNLAALIFLADRLDFFRLSYIDGLHNDLIVLQEELIADNIRSNINTLFEPSMAQAMIELCLTDGFWFGMDAENIEQIALNFNNKKWLDNQLSLKQVTELAHFMAHVVDAKSPFTYHHSEKVAELAKVLSAMFGFDDNTQHMIYIAGLMHDVGKLKTPDEILHKQGKLSETEYTRIKRHTTDTAITLRSFFPNSVIGEWAANHHERLDGTGYPNRLNAEQIDLPSRIIAVVDIFQALSQDRPYRGRLQADEIAEIMQGLVDSGKIDSEVFSVLLQNLTFFYELSVASTKSQPDECSSI